MYVYMRSWVCVPGGLSWRLDVFFCCLQAYCLEAGSLTEPGARWLAQWSVSLSVLLRPPTPALGLPACAAVLSILHGHRGSHSSPQACPVSSIYCVISPAQEGVVNSSGLNIVAKNSIQSHTPHDWPETKPGLRTIMGLGMSFPG